MKLKSKGLEFYVDKLRKGEPFAFTRYGNGEWDCILRKAETTHSGSQDLTAPRLRENLVNSIVNAYCSDDYLLALQSLGTLKRLGLLDSVEHWLKVNTSSLTWYAADVFHNACRDGLLAPLVRQLQNRRLVIVGPAHLRHLTIFDHLNYFIEVPARNCWTERRYIETSLLRTVQPGTVVSISAGPTTKPMIHWLYPRFRDTAFLIDFGSLWDVFVDKPSRNYQRRMSEATIRQNLS